MHRKHVLEVADIQVQVRLSCLSVEPICGCCYLLGELGGRHNRGGQAVLERRGLSHGETGSLDGFAQEVAARGLLAVSVVGVLSLQSLQFSDAVTPTSLGHRKSIYLHLLMCL